MAIESVGLIINETKQEALEFGRQVIAWLIDRGLRVLVDASAAAALGRPDLSCPDEDLCRTELLITLGGDGTILGASHLAAPHGIPLLGVHMGRFGFIAETLPEELPAHLDAILRGDMEVEERMMIEGDVVRDGAVVFSAVGLNDIVVAKGARTRLLNLRTEFNGGAAATYPADGVVVATPTGSTAYALSAGGPLVEPTVQALLVVPICAHTLAARPIVMPADEQVSITIETEGGEVLYSADSLHVFALLTGDRVVVRRAPFAARIIRVGGSSFYGKIRRRLLWGERLNS